MASVGNPVSLGTFGHMRTNALEPPIDAELSMKALPQLVVFPAYFIAENLGQTRWTVVVEGMATRPGRIDKISTRWSMSVMRRLMKATEDDLKDPMFLERVSPFVAKGMRKLDIDVQIGSQRFRLQRRTNRAGFFKARLSFEAGQLCKLLGRKAATPKAAARSIADMKSLTLRVDVRHISLEPQSVEAMPVPWLGWSLVSDIDDTIKDSQVSPLHVLLTNTFLNEFRSVTGMADLYRNWADQGVLFHYVSSSPWQLFQPIHRLCQKDQFPDGTFHLRSFRLSQDLWKKMLIFRQRGKSAIIRGMVRSLPQRRFILVGDSGEKDPEIYCRLARRYPDQIRAVFIRDLAHRQLSDKRLRKLNEGLPPGKIQAFTNARELQSMADETFH